MGERPDAATGSDPRILDDRRPDDRGRADRRVRKQRRWADDGARLDGGCTLEVATREDGHVLGDTDGRVNVGGCRVGDGHPGQHVPLEDPGAHQRLGPGQLHPVIHTECLRRRCRHRHSGMRACSRSDKVREVILPLRAQGHLRKGPPEPGGIEDVLARVDLGRATISVVVCGFHHRLHRPAGVADDAPEAPRVVHLARNERHHARAVQRLIQLMQEPGGDQRAVAVEHHYTVATGQGWLTTSHGVSGAQQLGLFDEADAGAGEPRPYLFRPVADHHHQPRGFQRAGRIDDMLPHGHATHRVKHLGQCRLHAGTQPRSEHDNTKAAHRAAPSARRLRRPGLEPGDVLGGSDSVRIRDATGASTGIVESREKGCQADCKFPLPNIPRPSTLRRGAP